MEDLKKNSEYSNQNIEQIKEMLQILNIDDKV